MSILSIPNIVMASINFYVGMYYLFLYGKKPQIKEHLPFALLCLGVGLYNVFCFGLYNSISVQTGVFWQRLQLDIGIAISILLIWFTGVFTEQKNNHIIPFFIAGLLVIFIATLIISPEYTLSANNPAIKNINLFNTLKITYYEGTVGLVYQIDLFFAVIAYLYLFFLFIQHFLHKKNKILALLFICQITYFVGVVNDSLVATRVYSFIYISEYSFFFIVIAMAYILMDRFINLYSAFEALNGNLEQKISERTLEIEKLNESFKYIADHDGLTGIYNRRFFNEYIEIETKRMRNHLHHNAGFLASKENDMNFGLAIVDIDHFKHINDTYGHLVGDSVLKQIIEVITKHIFTRDVLCRYGGDEFVLLLTKTSNEGILRAMEKIKNEIDVYSFFFDDEHPCQQITISVGLVNFNEVCDQGSLEIIKLADDRLLKAKNSGRNRIVYRD